MCLAIPMKVTSVKGIEAEVELNGTSQTVGLMLYKDVKPGDYVLIHAGYVIEKLKPEEAKETIELWEQIARESNDQEDR